MPLDIARIRLLCFDVDGTLSDTDDIYVKKALRLLPRFLFRDPVRAARRLVMWAEAPGNGLLGLADRLGLDLGRALAEQAPGLGRRAGRIRTECLLSQCRQRRDGIRH